MAAKFELKKSRNGQYLFNLKAANGEVILTSETYHEKGSAEKGIALVKANAANDKRYERKVAKNGQTYFTLIAANTLVIGMSEMYKSGSGRNNGIASVKKNAPGARVVDLT